MRLYHIILLIYLLTPLNVASSERSSEEIYHTTMESIDPTNSRAERMVQAAMALLGSPYISGSLEVEPEELIIDLRVSDCMIFVESCLAMVLNCEVEHPSYDSYRSIVQSLRYRGGVVDGYSSRLHYTSEWVLQALSNGYIKEITAQLGGVSYPQHFSFISSNSDKYRQLAADPQQVERIKEIEAKLTSRGGYYVIPKGQVSSIRHRLKDGDIVLFNTSIAGLDIAHLGIIYQRSFIHASTNGMCVKIEPRDLETYLGDISSNNAIRVLRLQ